MALNAHLETLKTKHDELDEQIKTALKTPSSDDLRISEMKKKKLALKDQITTLSS